jgi:hypothetical protein
VASVLQFKLNKPVQYLKQRSRPGLRMKSPKDIFEAKINKALDRDGSQLRRVLEIQSAYERMHGARYMLVHLLAFVGVIIWVEAIEPDLLPREVRLFTFILWGSFLFLTIWVAVEEYVLWRRFSAYSTRKGGVSSQETE